jgi:hypothetical protein
MDTRHRLFIVGAVTAVLATIVVVLFNAPGLSADSCAESELIRGCGTPVPTFVGQSCAEVGQEFGSQFNARLVTIIHGPQVVDGADRSAHATYSQMYLSDRANKYLRDNGMVKACDADEFVRAAEPMFSAEVRANAPILLFDPQATYADWIAGVRKEIGIIDLEEDSPYSPTSTTAQ